MRAVLLAALAALAASAGCLDGMRGVVPVVRVEESFGLDDARPPKDALRWDCSSGHLSLDPLGVTLLRGDDGFRPGFVLVHEGRGASQTFSAGSRGAWWLGSGIGGAGFGVDPPFPGVDGPSFAIRWDGEVAWLDDEPLREGEAATRTFRYDAPDEKGAPTPVVHTVRATYLGKISVRVEGPAACLLT